MGGAGLMTLTDEVQNRLSAQRLRNLTNPDAPNSSAIDTTRLNNAILDVQADFEIYAGVIFDLNDARHVAVAVDGVEAILIERAGLATEARETRRKAWEERLIALGKVTARDRILPKSNSDLEPTDEADPTGRPVRPAFDKRKMDGYKLNNLGRSET